MEGRNHQRRQRAELQPALVVLGAARYYAQYDWIQGVVEQHGGILLKFREAVAGPAATERQLDTYTGLVESLGGEKDEQFAKNTSFVNKKKRELSAGARFALERARELFASRPGLARGVYGTYDRRGRRASPLYRKLLKAAYFPVALEEELLEVNAADLVASIRKGK